MITLDKCHYLQTKIQSVWYINLQWSKWTIQLKCFCKIDKIDKTIVNLLVWIVNWRVFCPHICGDTCWICFSDSIARNLVFVHIFYLKLQTESKGSLVWNTKEYLRNPSAWIYFAHFPLLLLKCMFTCNSLRKQPCSLLLKIQKLVCQTYFTFYTPCMNLTWLQVKLHTKLNPCGF